MQFEMLQVKKDMKVAICSVLNHPQIANLCVSGIFNVANLARIR